MLVAEPEDAAENIGVILSLILDVVNGEDRADLIVPPVALIFQLEVDHGEGSLPVVRMQHIRHKVDVRLILPLYRAVGENFRAQMETIYEGTVFLGWRQLYVGIRMLKYTSPRPPVAAKGSASAPTKRIFLI